MLSLTVNGKPREIAAPTTLLAFLQAHDVNPQLIAVEYNGDIVKRERYAQITLQEGDRLEIVHMVGGGASPPLPSPGWRSTEKQNALAANGRPGAPSPDVVVVGGGVIGCAVAYYLARAGARVAVLERDRIAAEASSAAAGMLAPLAEDGAAGPFLDLTLASLSRFASLA